MRPSRFDESKRSAGAVVSDANIWRKSIPSYRLSPLTRILPWRHSHPYSQRPFRKGRSPRPYPRSHLVNPRFHELVALRRPVVSEFVFPELESRDNGNASILHQRERRVIQLTCIRNAMRQNVGSAMHCCQ
jgi:hypothetical protein